MATMKSNPQVFTPSRIVKYMLNIAGYRHNIVGKTIFENSFGNGAFLKEIVKRYITEGKMLGYSNEAISYGLSRDICGIEKDKSLFDECIKDLDKIVAMNKLIPVKWTLMNQNTLQTKIEQKYNFIIGNPPYITYSALKESERRFMSDNFFVCKTGKPDYYYAFIEYSMNALADDGKFVYIVPNNMTKTWFGDKLRNYILPDLIEIFDFKSEKIFQNILTKSVILHIQKNSKKNLLTYYDVNSKKTLTLDKREMGKKWIFGFNCDKYEAKFSDYFKAANSIATLLNEAFVVNVINETNDYYEIFLDKETVRIEKELVKKAASPKYINKIENEYIIFPYSYEKNKLKKLPEDVFINKFPLGYRYLCSYKDKLENRKSDNNAKWYEYGRSQALQHLNQPKLMLSTVITDKPNIVRLCNETIPYSGIFITKIGNYSLDVAKFILESCYFKDYIKTVGIHANGTSYRISTRDINDFRFPKNLICLPSNIEHGGANGKNNICS